MAGQDVAVLGGEVPARVDDEVLDLVGERPLHLRHVSQPEVDGDHVGVEPVTAGRAGAVPGSEVRGQR